MRGTPDSKKYQKSNPNMQGEVNKMEPEDLMASQLVV